MKTRHDFVIRNSGSEGDAMVLARLTSDECAVVRGIFAALNTDADRRARGFYPPFLHIGAPAPCGECNGAGMVKSFGGDESPCYDCVAGQTIAREAKP